jgi:RimJ/RimL family protein N-acetyltransferase
MLVRKRRKGDTMILRQAGKSDIEGVREYTEAFYAKECDMIVHWSPPIDPEQESKRLCERDREGAVVIIAEEDGRIMGHIETSVPSGEEIRHTCELGMTVLEQYRKRGIGTRLLQSLLAWARSRGLLIVKLQVYSVNAPAIALYTRLGFVEDGRTKNGVKLRSGAYCDMIHMSRHL